MSNSKTVTGKAIITLTKEDSKWVPFCLDDVEFLDGDEEQHDFVHEDFGLLTTDTLPCPDAAYDLEVGETVRVEVEYEFFYWTDYFGESDVELSYNSQKVLES